MVGSDHLCLWRGVRYAALLFALTCQREDRVGAKQCKVDTTRAPARFAVARKVSVGEQMRLEILGFVAYPSRQAQMLRGMDIAHKAMS